MNLVQLANDLEFVPKEQLAQMSQDPSSRFPSYLVLSEIQRRTQNEKAYAAAQPQPTTTVAEEVVGEFMQPQGMQAGMPPESAPTDVFSSGMSGMPASASMQQPMQMASGGLTSEEKLKDALQENALLSLEKKLGVKIPRKTQDLKDSLVNKILENKKIPIRTRGNEISIGGSDGLSVYMNSKDEANRAGIRYNKKFAGGGLTAYAAGDRTSLDQSFLSRGGEKISNFFSDRYQDEDGLDWSNIGLDAASAGLMFIPGIGWMAAGGLRAASLAANAARAGQVVKTGAQALKTAIPKTITKPGRVVKSKTGKEFGVNTTQGKSILSGKNPPKSFRSPNVPRDPSLTRASIATGAGLAGAMNLNYALDDTYNLDNKDIDTELSQADKDYNKRMQDIVLANQQAQLDQNALDQKKANRMFSPTDLIQLGGTVMGARDMSELGQGIAGVAGLSAQRKADEKQAGLQARYLQAQTGKLEAETAQLPERQILAEITGLTKQLSDLEESGGDDVQIQKIRDYLQYLSGELAKIRGYDPSMIAGNNQNVIASYT